MAHHQHGNNRQTAIQGLLKMFALSTSPTVPIVGEDELAAEADEPPDDQVSPLQTSFPRKDPFYTKSPTIPTDNRRESMLTRALLHGSSPEAKYPAPRAISNASSRSNASMASTAELTSDSDATTPSRAATPSPPLTLVHQMMLPAAPATGHVPSKISFAPVLKEDTEAAVPSNEAAVEKTLGRKRCIMFACGGKVPEKAPTPALKQEVSPTEPAPRKRMLTFACPSRQDTNPDLVAEGLERRQENQPFQQSRVSSSESFAARENGASVAPSKTLSSPDLDKRSSAPFHEFGSSADEPDEWAEEPTEKPLRKLTLTDCMKKENAIRQIGEEAEKEAEEEEQDEEDLQDADEDDAEDDFAPSDGSSDGGNESDDEGGFADSDDESDAGSDYQFWAPSKAPSTTTAATSHDNILIPQFRSNSPQRQSLASSIDSGTDTNMFRQYNNRGLNFPSRRRSPKLAKMRPSTPELPDSTDFVCGTLDEDRPLEAAYISCREQRKREKHIPIPQDIDPSFPTTDPEDNDDEDNEEVADGLDDHLWFRDQLDGMEDETFRGRGNVAVTKKPTQRSPRRLQSPPPRPTIVRHNTNRSPPPKPRRVSPAPRRTTLRSPPPRRLFGHSPPVQRSPPNQVTMRTPPGSLLNRPIPLGITINRLAQRPALGRTASLPHAPNPYFRNHKQKSPVASNIPSGGVTPGTFSEDPVRDRHVRGAVDIVIGLEKKRQKRKEKFWAKHCRKAAKEQAIRKPIPGRGAERMKELGLECAERTKGYGVGQQTQLVLSL